VSGRGLAFKASGIIDPAKAKRGEGIPHPSNIILMDLPHVWAAQVWSVGSPENKPLGERTFKSWFHFLRIQLASGILYGNVEKSGRSGTEGCVAVFDLDSRHNMRQR